MREEISYFDFLPGDSLSQMLFNSLDELMLRIFEYLDISALISVSEVGSVYTYKL